MREARVRQLQRRARGDGQERSQRMHSRAAEGVSGSAQALPHRETIQRAFGRHQIQDVKAHNDDHSARANRALGAEAFTVGDDVGFSGTPDLRLAAHEAAHVVQQRSGVQLKGGVDQPGDEYESHADEVADKVVRGESAERLLDQKSGGGRGGGGFAIQRHKGPKGDSAEAAAEGEAAAAEAATPGAEAKEEKKPEEKKAEGDEKAEAKEDADPIKAELDRLAKLDGTALAAAVADMSAELTQQIILKAKEDEAKYGEFLARFTNERVAAAAIKAKGLFEWVTAGCKSSDKSFKALTKGDNADREEKENSFIGWLYGGKPAPGDDGTLNCWQAVILSAFRAGVVTKEWVKKVHEDAEGAGQAAYAEDMDGEEETDRSAVKSAKKAGGDAWKNAIGKALKMDTAKDVDAENRPQRGDVVFMNDMDHVCLSLGPEGSKDKVMSLWSIAKRGGAQVTNFTETTIQKLEGPMTPVTYASNPWS
jgi:hypothetical protein